MECANLFCFLKSKKMRIPKKRSAQQRAQTKIFWPEKRRCCVPILFKEKRVFLYVEVDNCKEKMLQKKNVVEKRRRWSGFTPMSKSTQHNFHYTCNLVLHNTLWVIPSSVFLMSGGKKLHHQDRDKMTPPSLYCILQVIFHSFWTP